MAKKPPPVTDIREIQVIKHDRSFFLSDLSGDVPKGNTAALGLYHKDTRFLSQFELTMNRTRPLLLHSSTERNYSQLVELAFPFRAVDPQGFEHNENITMTRNRLLGDALFERIRVANFGRRKRTIRVSLKFDADFLDLFEVRGAERRERGQIQEPRLTSNQVTLAYRGLDGATRSTKLNTVCPMICGTSAIRTKRPQVSGGYPLKRMLAAAITGRSTTVHVAYTIVTYTRRETRWRRLRPMRK